MSPAISRQCLSVLPSSEAAPALGRPVVLEPAELPPLACFPAPEEPGLCLLELVHVVSVVGKKGTCRLHIADARELQLEVDAVALALGLELGDLAAQLLCRLGVLGRLGNLGFQGGDLLVALGDLGVSPPTCDWPCCVSCCSWPCCCDVFSEPCVASWPPLVSPSMLYRLS